MATLVTIPKNLNIASYTGPSIVDYLKSVGQPADVQSRAGLAVRQGLVSTPGEYVSLANQGKNAEINTRLLGMLRGQAGGIQAGGIQAGGIVEKPLNLGIAPKIAEPPSDDELKGLGARVGVTPLTTTPATIPATIPGQEKAPSIVQPPRPKLEEAFAGLLEEKGITALEADLTDIKSKIADEEARFRQYKESIKERPISAGAIAGRISEEERDYRENIDFLERRKTRAVDELNTKYKVVQTLMDLKGKDYSNATQEYETLFNQNIKTMDINRANLEVVRKSLADGELNYNDLLPDQKLLIDKLDMQIYGTSGITAKLKPAEKEIDSYTDPSGNRISVFYDQAARTTRSINTGKSNPAVNVLTLTEARRLNLPSSLAGRNEAEIGAELESSVVPPWFKEMIEARTNMSLTPTALADAWRQFQEQIRSGAKTGTGAGEASEIKNPFR